jgi:hypothetical protein
MVELSKLKRFVSSFTRMLICMLRKILLGFSLSLSMLGVGAATSISAQASIPKKPYSQPLQPFTHEGYEWAVVPMNTYCSSLLPDGKQLQNATVVGAGWYSPNLSKVGCKYWYVPSSTRQVGGRVMVGGEFGAPGNNVKGEAEVNGSETTGGIKQKLGVWTTFNWQNMCDVTRPGTVGRKFEGNKFVYCGRRL